MEDIIKECRAVVASEHGLAIGTFCLLEPRSIRKTTSGKVARAWCRRDFEDNTLRPLHSWNDESNGSLAQFQSGEVEQDDAATRREVQGGGGGEQQYEEKSGEAGVDAAVLARVPAEQLRAMSDSDIRSRLEHALLLVSNQGHAKLQQPIDPRTPLSGLGLDSLTIVQFKGILENRYHVFLFRHHDRNNTFFSFRFHCHIPDEFMFTQLATIEGLAQCVKIGHLTAEQQAMLQGGGGSSAAGGQPDVATLSTVEVVGARKEPLCPWFTCCY